MDTTNVLMVLTKGDGKFVVMHNSPLGTTDKEEALMLAAWRMVMSGASRAKQIEAIEAVEQT